MTANLLSIADCEYVMDRQRQRDYQNMSAVKFIAKHGYCGWRVHREIHEEKPEPSDG